MTKPAERDISGLNQQAWRHRSWRRAALAFGGFAAVSLFAITASIGEPWTKLASVDRFSQAVWMSALSTPEKPCFADEAGLTVAKLNGVSADLNVAADRADVDEGEARNAFFGNGGKDPAPGQKVVLKTDDGRRFSLKVARRIPLTDQSVPETDGIVSVVPVSGARTMTYSWGNWRYVIEVEELDAQPPVAVQQSL